MAKNQGLSSLFGSYVVHEDTTREAILRMTVRKDREESSFYHLSVDELVRRLKLWRLQLPRVTPHYAVKCNNDSAVLRTLALLGTGFDCASRNEMASVLALGVSPARIIFAHPCKIASHVRYAKTNDIRRMTFDSSQELIKVSKLFPNAELVLRIRCDAASAQCQLGMKFGVPPEEAQPLLVLAAELKLRVVGVAFHVGSGCAEPQVFLRAIKASKQVFAEAEAEGHKPTLLDIGGGYLGGKLDSINEAAGYINQALDEHFPEGCGVTVIAEPGRYMVSSAFTLATPIINRRDVAQPDGSNVAMLFIDDGLYGSFNCVLYDHQVVKPIPLKDESTNNVIESSIWGPTCDGFDQVISSVALPASLGVGDWIVWEDMGAYTLAAAGNFNGFPLPEVVVHMHTHTAVFLEGLLDELLSSSPRQNCSSEESSGVCSDEEYCNSAAARRDRPELLCCSVASKLNKHKKMRDHQMQLLYDDENVQQQLAALINAYFASNKDMVQLVEVQGHQVEDCREM